MEKKLEAIVTTLLKHLEIKPESLTITKGDESLNIDLKLTEKDTGILIGYHGDTITALQQLLGLMLFTQTKEWIKVVLDINDYRLKRQNTLEETAKDTAEKVKTSGQPMALFNLNPYERRLVHEFLSKDSSVTTQSDGEGDNRHLIISPAETK